MFQALSEADIEPDWVTGVSIGAINSAIIAGNSKQWRLKRLRTFWERITERKIWNYTPDGDVFRKARNAASSWMTLIQGQPGFFSPRHPTPWFSLAGAQSATSYYDNAPLRETLEDLVDFSLLNEKTMRFSVGAVNVLSGNFVYFDTTTHKIRPEHIMASGALPPGCPAIEVDGELYWDGGLVSNTPLQWVVRGDTRNDTLVLQVDLWSARGELPSDLNDVMARQKEIQYSSRTRANTDQFKEIQSVRVALANVLDQIPPDILESEDGKLLRAVADRKVYQIVHLIYRSKNYEVQSKDYEFSRTSMTDHWNAGYNDAIRTLRHPEALERPTDSVGVSTFDLAVNGRE